MDDHVGVDDLRVDLPLSGVPAGVLLTYQLLTSSRHSDQYSAPWSALFLARGSLAPGWMMHSANNTWAYMLIPALGLA
jgi:hypothetical protein